MAYCLRHQHRPCQHAQHRPEQDAYLGSLAMLPLLLHCPVQLTEASWLLLGQLVYPYTISPPPRSRHIREGREGTEMKQSIVQRHQHDTVANTREEARWMITTTWSIFIFFLIKLLREMATALTSSQKDLLREGRRSNVRSYPFETREILIFLEYDSLKAWLS